MRRIIKKYFSFTAGLLVLLVSCSSGYTPGEQPGAVTPGSSFARMSTKSSSFTRNKLFSEYKGDFSPSVKAALDWMQRGGTLGVMVKDGAAYGLEKLLADYPAEEFTYTDLDDCLETVKIIQADRDLSLSMHRWWCESNLSNPHDRKGCRDVADIFYKHITAAEVCWKSLPVGDNQVSYIPDYIHQDPGLTGVYPAGNNHETFRPYPGQKLDKPRQGRFPASSRGAGKSKADAKVKNKTQPATHGADKKTTSENAQQALPSGKTPSIDKAGKSGNISPMPEHTKSVDSAADIPGAAEKNTVKSVHPTEEIVKPRDSAPDSQFILPGGGEPGGASNVSDRQGNSVPASGLNSNSNQQGSVGQGQSSRPAELGQVSGPGTVMYGADGALLLPQQSQTAEPGELPPVPAFGQFRPRLVSDAPPPAILQSSNRDDAPSEQPRAKEQAVRQQEENIIPVMPDKPIPVPQRGLSGAPQN